MSNLDFHTQNYIVDGVRINKSLVEEQASKRRDNLFFLVISFLVLSLMLVVIVLNTYVFFIADVSGGSMETTLMDGNKLITNRYKQPKIDSIVTIKHKTANGNYELWIKRIIAMGGDTVEIKDGYVYVNGKLKDEPYLNNKNLGATEVRHGVTRWELADDEIFFLGDNRQVSLDAREVGPCKLSDVVGVVENWSLKLNELFN